MQRITLIVAVALAALAGACTTDQYGYQPYYGPSQGYAYPSDYGYYGRRPYYRQPYYYGPGYGGGYGGGGPSITFNLPAGSVP